MLMTSICCPIILYHYNVKLYHLSGMVMNCDNFIRIETRFFYYYYHGLQSREKEQSCLSHIIFKDHHHIKEATEFFTMTVYLYIIVLWRITDCVIVKFIPFFSFQESFCRVLCKSYVEQDLVDAKAALTAACSELGLRAPMVSMSSHHYSIFTVPHIFCILKLWYIT